jgi:DNA polymerase/3'-5' exonuclease PolX
MRLDQARHIAMRLVKAFGHYCDRVEIGGSIRRGGAEVKDIEIVCVPKMLPDESRLFADSGDLVSYLDRYLENIVAGDWLKKDQLRSPAWGERYKRLRCEGAPVDLFIVRPPAQWGLIYLIRTGPADFSKRLVTQREKGGLLPDDCQVTEGRIVRSTPQMVGEPHRHVIDTPEEEDVFRVLGIDWIEPGERA